VGLGVVTVKDVTEMDKSSNKRALMVWSVDGANDVVMYSENRNDKKRFPTFGLPSFWLAIGIHKTTSATLDGGTMRSHHLVLLLLAYCRAQLFARNAALLNKGGAVTFETTLGLADVRVTLRGYFRRAADKWGKIITEPLTPKSLTQAQKDDFQRRGCKDDLPDTIENIFVCNSVRSLGSSGNGILAYAAPMAWRSGTRGLPYIGRVVVNNNKVSGMISAGILEETIVSNYPQCFTN